MEKKKTSVVTWLVLATVVIVAGNAMLADDPAPTPKPELTADEKAARAKSAEGLAYVMAAEKIVAAGLKDPASATFTGSFYRAPHVCGYVNAKNSFGGFTGNTEFLVNAETGMVLISDGKPAFASLWNKNCT